MIIGEGLIAQVTFDQSLEDLQNVGETGLGWGHSLPGLKFPIHNTGVTAVSTVQR